MKTRGQKVWYRRWWAWSLWTLLALLLLFVGLLIWAWTQRFELIEGLVVDTLAESGFEAELDIMSLSQTAVRVQNIRVRTENGSDVLRADELRANYIWPDVRDGILTRLEIDGVKLNLTLGEDWKPSDSWLKNILKAEPNAESKAKFPTDGVLLKDGTLILKSPLGEAAIYIDAEIPNETQFTTEVTLAPSDLAYGGFAANGAGFMTLTRDGSKLTLTGQTQTDTLSNKDLQIEDAHLRLNGIADLEAQSYSGQVTIDGQKITSEIFAADGIKLDWRGDLSRSTSVRAKGAWAVTTQNARTPNHARAKELAETLSLSPALSVVPVTEHFSPQLSQMVEGFLRGADITGSGQLNYEPEGFVIAPDQPVIIQTGRNKLTLTPRAEAAFYRFDRTKQTISAKMDAHFKQPVGLQMNRIDLRATSEDGIRLGKVERFAADLKTISNWRTSDLDGRPVRLGPVHSKLNYRTGSPRRLSVDTALDYDGYLPGGVVEALRLKGRLDVRLYEDRQVIDFTPRSDSRITVARLETPTDWVVENASFSLPPTKSLFTRTSKKAQLSAMPKAAKFDLTRPANDDTPAQHLDLHAVELAVEGIFYPDRSQHWDVDFSEAQYASETLPGPGTLASAPIAKLIAQLSPDAPVQINLTSPAITAETPLVRFSNMQIELAGTPDEYIVKHSGGDVNLIGSELLETATAAGLAQFPADGTVNFANEQFKGRVNLTVAKANDAPMTVDYVFADGAGEAQVDIPSIQFEPQGLQPQALLPALRGKIARVEGAAKVKLQLAFADGELTHSSGIVDLQDMNLGTAPGPITGLNTSLKFTSLLPLETDGAQILKMDSFNPGLELKDGVVTYRLVPDGVSVDEANWPIGNGTFSLDPFTWTYTAEENRVTMRVKNVSLSDFLNDVGNRRINATGNIVGVFPIVVRGVEVLVENGELSVPDGGVIRFEPGPGTPDYSLDEAIGILREQRRGEYAQLAQDALREFRYRYLSAKVHGPLDGDMEVGLNFDGANQKVLNSQPFRFDISVRGKLVNIARSLNFNDQVKAEVLRQYNLDTEDAASE